MFPTTRISNTSALYRVSHLLALAFLALPTGLADAQVASGSKYSLESFSVSTGGGDTASEMFDASSAIGESSPVGDASSPRFDVDPGADPADAVGGSQLPGDCNQDRSLDISDAVCIFGVLFLGTPGAFPCGDGSTSHPANIALIDWQRDRVVDISDGISALQFLFVGGPPHVLAVPGRERTACIEIVGCATNSQCW